MAGESRGALIEVEQLPSGYWLGQVQVWIPGLDELYFHKQGFHNAAEALDWARLTIETAVAHA